MNNSRYQHRFFPALLITAVFLAVILTFFWSAGRYWSNVLQPRLAMAAESHANVLASAQASSLLPVRSTPEQQRALLNGKLQELLLISDPSVGEPFFRAVEMMFDYELLEGEPGYLDMAEGVSECSKCYKVEVPLTRNNELLGIATLWVSDAYYRRLSSDMRARLLNEMSAGIIVLVIVWLVILGLYFRLQNAKVQLERSDKSKTLFLANVSHELRTPLNAILGYTQLYKRNASLMQSYGQGIETIDRSADHLLLMINDILDFSRAESDKVELHCRNFSLPEFLGQLAEMTRIRAHLKDITFEQNVADELPQTVVGDDKRLRQVLLNLLNNAVKFTHQGGVVFSVTCREEIKQQGLKRLRFEVRDSGPGIPADQLEEIFLPFRQLGNGSAEGSGLGLAISRNLLRLMGTDLHVSSKEGEGSCFWFELALPEGETSSFRHAGLLPNAVVGYEGRELHLLSVDDNAMNRDVIHQRLSSYGFKVSDAASGAEALAILSQEPVDAVLLDLLMPEQDGFEVLEAIRKTHDAERLPVIAMTAATQSDIADRVKQSDFADIVLKPATDEMLLAALAETLSLTWRYAAPAPEVEQVSLRFPEAGPLRLLQSAARQHDVLALREQLAKLDEDAAMKPFVEQVRHYLKRYQFTQLAQWLDSE
jgi:signal transduction histidine kinase/CheY-like chemotaxis protein